MAGITTRHTGRSGDQAFMAQQTGVSLKPKRGRRQKFSLITAYGKTIPEARRNLKAAKQAWKTKGRFGKNAWGTQETQDSGIRIAEPQGH